MSAPHGCIDDKVVVETFKEALKERIGADRFRMWFTHGVAFAVQPSPIAKTDDDEASGEVEGVPGELTYPSSLLDSGMRLVVLVSGQFALDRLRQNFLQQIRAAAAQACGSTLAVAVELGRPEPTQVELPLDSDDADEVLPQPAREHTLAAQAKSAAVASKTTRPSRVPKAHAKSSRKRGPAQSLSSLLANGSARSPKPKKSRPIDNGLQPALPNFETADSPAIATSEAGKPASTPSGKPALPRDSMTLSSFVAGSSNQLAHTAVMMACQSPGSATPLFLYGPSGIGKTHLINAIAEQFRRRHRMRSVVQLSGEKFTNDFCKSVGTTGLPAFRKRYREVDALLIDGVQFLSAKSATLREMLYTVEALIEAGRPIIFTANQAPSEIEGLSRELSGRMASGLVCPMHSLDATTRGTVLRRLVEQRCSIPWPEEMIAEVNAHLAGDGRVLSGIVNLVATLQKMFGRMATMDEIRQFGGDLLRVGQASVTLSTIERTVCQAFQLPIEDLRGSSQARAVCEPRMLAMYLSRQLTSSAYAEIAHHFGGRSHSTAIAAEKNVKKWLESGKAIGRGPTSVSAREAVDRIENQLRTA
ncbi:Chromosomal replication initiator protein DnaA [Novipirellula galeiformis]|uniref:Chromosomal replication initiator protein DnaA n=1 Tax=Novipirellula galeiformis TaxID=2528004 RepID=A0A5C6CFQ2_9BACT|nr:DnaA/Hda family protein [Novipirellula galeiformis]TWU23128.1 Chromosomal replication initiator protein DnaA [Novipirellula galeiformis]